LRDVCAGGAAKTERVEVEVLAKSDAVHDHGVIHAGGQGHR